MVGPSWPVAAASLGPALAWHTAGAPCLGLELLRIHCQHLGVSSAQPGGASQYPVHQRDRSRTM